VRALPNLGVDFIDPVAEFNVQYPRAALTERLTLRPNHKSNGQALQAPHKKNAHGRAVGAMVPRARIELATPGFSDLCSTD